MRLKASRRPRTVVGRYRAGRKMLEPAGDTEILALRQASRSCRVYPLSREVAPTIARLAYARRPA
jgi:hypothetical protein